jgi:propionyl-CoA carboxylase alpha chain
MNTKLQVEHPITEAVSGVDLVRGMLHIGAGHGIPQDFLDKLGDNEYMPYCGHAVEGRIYAEDPLRGFLPSTGPLIPYQEPVLEGVRVDSGVTQGHVVSPHYDPMLAKVICYADNRKNAVEGLAVALDNYVIEGVQHNARLVNSVLRHPAFIEGKTPTSFLPTHYPDGFHGVELSTKQKDMAAAIMVMVGKIRQETLRSPLVPGSSDEIIVRLGGMFGEAFSVSMLDETTAHVKDLEVEGDDRIITLDAPLDYKPMNLLARASIGGKLVTVQVLGEDVTGEIKIQMYGADIPVLLQSRREYELSKHMHVPKIVDTSSMVMSPMPGALIKVSVEVSRRIIIIIIVVISQLAEFTILYLIIGGRSCRGWTRVVHRGSHEDAKHYSVSACRNDWQVPLQRRIVSPSGRNHYRVCCRGRYRC